MSAAIVAPEFLYHRNGRGKLFNDAEANRATFIDKTSSAHDFSKLRDCRLVDKSHVTGNAQIYGGDLCGARVGGDTIIAGSPLIRGSLLLCSEVSGTPKLQWVDALDGTEICDSPVLCGHPTAGNLILRAATIYGSPAIIGAFTVTGRVHEGTWTRPPKHIKLPWCDLSECVDGKILLNCYCRPVEWFLRFGHRLAAKWDWSEDMVSITMETIRKEFV